MTTAHRPNDHSSELNAPPAVPTPRTAMADSLRQLLPVDITPVPGDLAGLLGDLVEVAVWTAEGGSWQEHASFLLGTRDGRWHIIGFTDPTTAELVTGLRALPGFDTDRLLDLIGKHTHRVHTLWRHPTPT